MRLTSILALSGYNSEELPLEPACLIFRHAFLSRDKRPLASVYPSVRIYQIGSHQPDLLQILCLRLLFKSIEKMEI